MSYDEIIQIGTPAVAEDPLGRGWFVCCAEGNYYCRHDGTWHEGVRDFWPSQSAADLALFKATFD